jgi:hypothetical protein
MTQHTATPIRRPEPIAEPSHRNVRLPASADSRLFGGWGIRF